MLKARFLMVLAILAFGLSMVGCDNGTTGPKEDVNDINKILRGHFDVTIISGPPQNQVTGWYFEETGQCMVLSDNKVSNPGNLSITGDVLKMIGHIYSRELKYEIIDKDTIHFYKPISLIWNGQSVEGSEYVLKRSGREGKCLPDNNDVWKFYDKKDWPAWDANTKYTDTTAETFTYKPWD